MKVSKTMAALALAGLASIAAVAPAQAGSNHKPADRVNLSMQASNAALAACFPHARATVSVTLTTEDRGFDTVRIRARGLQPNTQFTMFFLEQPGLPFGAAEYFGDFTTDRYGRGTGQFELIAEEAFAFDNASGKRVDLNSVGFWFADETADDACLGAASPVTGFDGDAKAGVQMMNSGANLLP